MIAPSGPWTLGVLIGLPVGILIIAGLTLALVKAIGFYKATRGSSWDRTEGTVALFGTSTLLILAVGMTVISLFPYDSEYHQLRKVHGTVQQVSSRLIGSDSGMSQRFVVVINGQPFGVDDTRASLLHVGDTVTLRCTREWQYASDSGWGCSWGAS